MNNPKVKVVVSGHRNEYYSTYKTYILRGGIPFADQVIMPDIKYVIKYDFDLGGRAFDLDFSNADTHTVAEVTYYYIPFTADGSKYTLMDDTLVFVDAEWNGLSAREIKPEKGTLFMIASITGGLHKNGYGVNVVTVPKNCILEFDGGSLRNGTIIGQDTFVNNVGGVADIFGLGIDKQGTWRAVDDDSVKPGELANYYTKSELDSGEGKRPTVNEVEQMISDILKDVDDHLDATSVNPVQNKVVTEALNDISAGIANVSLSVSPNAVFVGEQSGIVIGAISNMAASEIKIKRGDTVIGTGSGTTLNASDVITSSNAGNIAYAAEFTIAGRVKTASKNVAAVYPIYYGAGQTYFDATQKASVRTSPAGTYTINIPNTGDHVFFVVPRNMNISKATMSSFDFPLSAPVNIEIFGVAYKYYKDASDVGYTAGSVTIVVI